MWHGFLTWHAEMSPSQVVWKIVDSEVYAEVRADLAYVSVFQVMLCVHDLHKVYDLSQDSM